MKAIPIAEIGFPMLAFISEFSVSGSCGGETGTVVASVGGYVLGEEICEGLDAFVSWESGLDAVFSELVTVTPLTGSLLGSLSGPLFSTMGVRARRAASGPDGPGPMRGREVEPFCGIPVAGTSVEEREGCVEGTLEFGGLGTAI